MKRYLIFKGEDYYPAGGALDFIGAERSLKKAKEVLGTVGDYEWGHVYDLQKKEIVWEGE